jgi:hypothetical protein
VTFARREPAAKQEICGPTFHDPFDSAMFLSMNTNPQKGDIRVAEKSAIQRIKDLDAERASIFDHAKEEAPSSTVSASTTR